MGKRLSEAKSKDVTPVDVLPVEEKALERLGAGLPVTRDDLTSIRDRISLLKEFVATQLVKEVDWGTIPGTPKPSLFQPGAQKLARLFGLTVQKECTDRVIDHGAKFAMFAYRASVYHARTGQLIAQCEGAANSQEKKYQKQNYTDMINTLMKMAQKRAMVGAVIEACGASDFFTQDIDSPEDARVLGIRPEPQRAKVSVPQATSARSHELPPPTSGAGPAPQCCGKPMMISKYHQDTWYCTGCKGTVPMITA